MALYLQGSYSHTNTDGWDFINGDGSRNTANGQCFVASQTGRLYSAKLYLKRTGTLTGVIQCAIYATTGTVGTNATPTGSSIANAQIKAWQVPTTASLVEFRFPFNTYITSGTSYFLTIWYTTNDGSSNYIETAIDTTSPTPPTGNFAIRNNGGTWMGTAGNAMPFFLYTGTRVTYRSANTANSGGTASNTITVNTPSGYTQGDTIVLHSAWDNSTGATATAPSGFSSFVASTTGNLRRQIFYKYAGASEPSSYSISLSQSVNWAVSATAWTGVESTSMQAGSFSGTTTSTSTVPTSSATSSNDDATFMRSIAHLNTTGALTLTSPGTNFTTRADTSSTVSPYIGVAVAEYGTATNIQASSYPSAGSTTLSGTASNISYNAFGLRPSLANKYVPTIDFAYTSSVSSNNTVTTVAATPVGTGRPVYVAVSMQVTGGVTVSSVTNTSGMTLSLIASSQDANNTTRTELWGGTTTSSASQTFTINLSTSTNFRYFVFSPVGAKVDFTNVVTANATSGNPSTTVTTTDTFSQVYSFTTMNANTGISNGLYDVGTIASGSPLQLFKTNRLDWPVFASGTSAPMTFTTSTSQEWSMVSIEVKASHATTTHTTDSMVRVQTTKTHTTNSLIATNVTKTHTSNSMVRGVFTKTHTADAVVKNVFTKSHTTNSMLAIRLTKIHTANAMIRAAYTRTHATDTRTHGIGTKVHTTDTAVDWAVIEDGAVSVGLIERRNQDNNGNLGAGSVDTGGFDRKNLTDGGELEQVIIDDSGIWPEA